MSIHPPYATPDQPMVYEIRLEGHLGHQWTDWFEGLTLTLDESGDTRLTGPVVDQAALHGLLKKVRDLGTPLISVIRVQPVEQDDATLEPGNSSISGDHGVGL